MPDWSGSLDDLVSGDGLSEQGDLPLRSKQKFLLLGAALVLPVHPLVLLAHRGDQLGEGLFRIGFDGRLGVVYGVGVFILGFHVVFI